MSHFSTLVITDFQPDEQTLGPVLQPWHEKDDVWQIEIDKLLSDLPPNAWLSVVDCHV